MTECRWWPCGLLVLVACHMGEPCAAETAVPRDHETAHGEFVSWRPFSPVTSRILAARADQSRTWLAILRRDGNQVSFRVYALSEDCSVRDNGVSPAADGYGVFDFAWCGERLVFVEAPGLDRLVDIEANIAAHSQTVVWDPETGRREAAIQEGFTAILPHPVERLIAGFSPMSRLAEASVDGTFRTLVQTRALPDLSVVREAQTPFAQPMTGSFGIPWPVCWSPDAGGWFILKRVIRHRRHGGPEFVGVLEFVSQSGMVTELGETGNALVRMSTPTAIPTLCPINGGRCVAGYVERAEGKDAIVVYGPDGPVRTYELGAWGRGLGAPLKLARKSRGWRFIVCAPDGKRALFQQRRIWDDDPSNDASLQVWCWDLEADEGFLVTEMPEITQCFGWVSEGAVIVGSAAEPAGQHAGGHQYGVLHLRKPPESQADETEGQQQRQKGDD